MVTWEPHKIVRSIGHDVFVVHGTDGPPGVLLEPRGEVSIDIENAATSLRILAMVAPTMVPDNFVTNVIVMTFTHGQRARSAQPVRHRP